jgi:TPR repeat protein
MQFLGTCFEQGTGVEKNLKLALEWYRKGAANGLVECQIGVALCCWMGLAG